MTVIELRTLEKPITAVQADEVPATLLGRATTYNKAVDAFRVAIRGALDDVQRGRTIEPDRAGLLRACAADLVTARTCLLELARLPAASRNR
jgi:hypothetical protein